MDEQTALVLALQLVALFSIAGALLVYLLCKIRTTPEPEAGVVSIGGGKSVLITSCDTAIGLQVALHLGNRGFRVFAGLKDGAGSGAEGDSVPARVIRAWQKHRESIEHTQTPLQGTIVALPLDVIREDLLHEAVDIIRAHLPAGEDGVWAVLCTSGVTYRGRLEQQDITHWDAILKTNVVGLLRTARTFQGLLRNTKGRLVTVGTVGGSDVSSVACSASRYAVQGASEALRRELAPAGIRVVTLQPRDVGVEALFAAPRLDSQPEDGVCLEMGACVQYKPHVLSDNALLELELALTCREPRHNQTLSQNVSWSSRLAAVRHV